MDNISNLPIIACFGEGNAHFLAASDPDRNGVSS